MLIYNISRTLVNGSTGFVTGYSSKGYPVVTFDDGTSLTVEPITLAVTDPTDPNRIVAQRTQVPLKLAWAITTHKSQGMTLPCIEVHCGNEFKSGQLYVALSRAKESAGVSLVGFSKAKLISPPMVVERFYSVIVAGHEVPPLGQCCNNCTDYKNEVCQDLSSCEPDSAWEFVTLRISVSLRRNLQKLTILSKISLKTIVRIMMNRCWSIWMMFWMGWIAVTI